MMAMVAMMASGAFFTQHCALLDGASKAAGYGCHLLDNGWKQEAECYDGHTWSYLLQHDDELKLCKGINARGGATESPCEGYAGDVTSYKKMTQQSCWGEQL